MNIISFLNGILAGFFDKIRLASPIAYVALMVIVLGFNGYLESGDTLINLPSWLNEVITGLVAILLSSRTKRHLDGADDSPAGVNVQSVDHDD